MPRIGQKIQDLAKKTKDAVIDTGLYVKSYFVAFWDWLFESAGKIKKGIIGLPGFVNAKRKDAAAYLGPKIRKGLSWLSVRRWWTWKKMVVFARKHLSVLFACILGIVEISKLIIEHLQLVVLSDGNIVGWFVALSLLWLHLNEFVWSLIIYIFAALTVIAALWELLGNHLAASEQEVRYIVGMEDLIRIFNQFERKLNSTAETPTDLLIDFITKLLAISSYILCGKHEVDVSFMFYQDLGESLERSLVLKQPKLFKASQEPKKKPSRRGKKYEFLDSLTIHLGVEHRKESDVGPAEQIYKKVMEDEGADETRWRYLVHMPKKKKRLGIFLMQMEGEEYKRPEEYFYGWYEHEATKEEFGAVLSVPVHTYVDDKNNKFLGVLNFNTRRWDFFVRRDYVIAKTFASLIAEAVVLTRQKMTLNFQAQLAQKSK